MTQKWPKNFGETVIFPPIANALNLREREREMVLLRAKFISK